MTNASTNRNYGDGITHPAPHPSSLPRLALIILPPQFPHPKHNANTLQHHDTDDVPIKARIDEVTDAMNDARDMLMRTFRTLLHANRNTASNGSSHKPCSSHQPLYTPFPPITHHTTNPTHPASISRSIPTSMLQKSLSTQHYETLQTT